MINYFLLFNIKKKNFLCNLIGDKSSEPRVASEVKKAASPRAVARFTLLRSIDASCIPERTRYRRQSYRRTHDDTNVGYA